MAAIQFERLCGSVELKSPARFAEHPEQDSRVTDGVCAANEARSSTNHVSSELDKGGVILGGFGMHELADKSRMRAAGWLYLVSLVVVK